MKRILALAALVLLGAAQDDLEKKVDDLIVKLSDESIDVRDDAVQAIVDLGPAALPILRKRLEKLEGEPKNRVDEAIRKIEAKEIQARVLPALKNVTIEQKDKPVREALEELGKQTGLPLEYAQASVDGSITVSIKDATPLQALDEICRKAGQLMYYIQDDYDYDRTTGESISKGVRVRFHNSPFVDYPSAHVRHYKAHVTQITLQKTNNFQTDQSTGSMNLQFTWTPDVKPEALRKFQLTELVDDKERSLLVPDSTKGYRGYNKFRYHGGWSQSSVSEYAAFKYPEADAKKIARLRGVAVVRFPLEVKSLKFEKPAESKGKSFEVKGVKITLKDYRVSGNTHTVVMELSGKYDRAKDPYDEGEERGSYGEQYPFSYEDVRLETESGGKMQNGGMSGSGDGKIYKWELSFHSQKAETVNAIQIDCVLSHFYDEVKFELKDVPLPK